ncbi:group II intron reverse transcriptase/maturase [Tessaracoccus caeni]|uniref:group II intron reverse transcriptase/maturase n=1 Tax=Tessaracoccus caeni TaxID=3031239 RepID=UPI0023D987DE|nr:group II intron reverse transcriptase/maturase [Tessaracoccus caeni]MDF1490377.1 group II intron reverse transcriptase/maturase [Tessaracoccus caeni]
MTQDALVNSDALTLMEIIGARVARTQVKYHRWARADRETRFGDLFNLVSHPDYLWVAWDHVTRNKGARTAGVDGLTVRQLRQRDEVGAFLTWIAASLRDGTYRPSPVRRVLIPKPGGKSRPLGIPTVADRVVQQSLKMVLEPIFEADFLPVSYGFRPKRRTHDAVAEIHYYASRGYRWVVDADIEGCFDHIDHSALLTLVRRRIKDKQTVALVRAFLKAGVLDELGREAATSEGTPQGGIISPLLANIALSVLDEAIMAPWADGGEQSTQAARAKRRYHGKANWRIVRYADDFVILTNGDRDDAVWLKEHAAGVLARVGLRLSESKTTVAHLSEGIDFLGFRIQWRQRRGSGKWFCMVFIADKAFRKIKQTIRALIPRRSPRPLADVISEVNAVLRGWTYYFRHAIAGRRFAFLRYFTWRRFVAWQRTLHRWGWNGVKRWLRQPDGSWNTITAPGIVLFDPTKVRIGRYWYRGTRIPNPYDPSITA